MTKPVGMATWLGKSHTPGRRTIGNQWLQREGESGSSRDGSPNKLSNPRGPTLNTGTQQQH